MKVKRLSELVVYIVLAAFFLGLTAIDIYLYQSYIKAKDYNDRLTNLVKPISIKENILKFKDNSAVWINQQENTDSFSISYPNSWKFSSYDQNAGQVGSHGGKVIHMWSLQKILSDNPGARLQVIIDYETNPLNQKYSFTFCDLRPGSCKRTKLNNVNFIRFDNTDLGNEGISMVGGNNGKVLTITINTHNASNKELEVIDKILQSIRL